MPGVEDERAVRGSYYLLLDTSNSFKTWERVSSPPLVGSPFLGFRCARDGGP